MLQLLSLGFVLLLQLVNVDCFTPKSSLTYLSQTHAPIGNAVEKTKIWSSNQESTLASETSFFCDEVNSESASASSSSVPLLNLKVDSSKSENDSFSYAEFAKQYPFINNVAIATIKTGAADFIAQTVIGQTSILEIDLQRSFLFMTFGAVYSGGFQWLYQVLIFKRLFDIEEFTNLSWREKLEDKEGLKTLALQTALDLTVMTFIYLPTFYIFKAGVFSGSSDPSVWVSNGLGDYTANFSKDEVDALRVWFPADLVCFSVPLYLRLPVRHVVSFVWTAYLSFSRGGH